MEYPSAEFDHDSKIDKMVPLLALIAGGENGCKINALLGSLKSV